jgi:hypothetical protein
MWQLCYYSHIIFLNFIIDFVAPNFNFKAFLLFNILRPKVPKSTDYRLPKSLQTKQQITKLSNLKSTDYRLPKPPQKQATDYQTIKPKKHR